MLVDVLYRLENNLVLPKELFEVIFMWNSDYSKEDIIFKVLLEYQYNLEHMALSETEKAIIAKAYNSLPEDSQPSHVKYFLWAELHSIPPKYEYKLEDFYESSSWEEEEQRIHSIIHNILKDIPTDGICDIAWEQDYETYGIYSKLSYQEAYNKLLNDADWEYCDYTAHLVTEENIREEINSLRDEIDRLTGLLS